MFDTCVLSNLQRPDLLAGTLRSLARSGLQTLTLYCDRSPEPSPGNHACVYLAALRAMTERAEADGSAWLLMCEDDIGVPVGFGDHLSHLCSLLAPQREILGFATLFCSLGYRDWVNAHRVAVAPQFGRLIPDDCYAGTQCLLLPICGVRQLIPPMEACRKAAPDWGGDRILGAAVQQLGLEAWCHTPSLVDHRGRQQTTVASRADNLAMVAADYVGDETGSWELEAGSWGR